MLHIKDIEAFARINESLFRKPGEAEADLSDHPAVLLARLMAAAQAAAEENAAKPAEVAEPEAVREAAEESTEPARPMTMAGLFSRMMFGRR